MTMEDQVPIDRDCLRAPPADCLASAIPMTKNSPPDDQAACAGSGQSIGAGLPTSIQSLRVWLGAFWINSGRTGALGLADQVIVSGMRFATTVLVGRFCGATELGIYAIAFSVMLTVQNVQDSVILGPYIVYGSRMKGTRKSLYAGSVLCEAMFLTVLAVLAVTGLTFAFRAASSEPTLWRTVGVLGATIPFILLHQFGRRFAFAELNIRTAILLDASAASIQLAGVVLLAVGGVLSAATTFTVVGVACALPAVVWLVLHWHSFVFCWPGFPADLRTNWRIGRWMLASQLTATLGTFISSWLLALLLSVKAAGLYAACASIVCLTNPILLGLSNVLVPRASQAFSQGGYERLRRVSRESMLLVTSMTGAAAIVLILFGQTLLSLLYGVDYTANQQVITILAIATLFGAASMSADQGLTALERTDLGFGARAIGVAATAFTSLWLIPRWGLLGAAVSPLVGNAVTAAFVIFWHEQLTRPYRVAGRTS